MSPDQPCVDPTKEQTLCGLVLDSIVLRRDGVRFKDLLDGFVAHLLKMLPCKYASRWSHTHAYNFVNSPTVFLHAKTASACSFSTLVAPDLRGRGR